MKYCRNCSHLSVGKPLFCATCGRSYGSTYCPKLHRNGPSAAACSQCGSTDLSLTDGVGSRLSRGVLSIAGVFGVLLLVATTAYLVYFIIRFLRNPDPSLDLLLVGFGIGFVWFLFSLPTRRGR